MRKIDVVTELYNRTLKELTSSPRAWTDFLHTAAYQYKYSFSDQVLIHAQRPGAIACAELEVWNRFGRWVNRGSHGIALIRERGSRSSLTHVFDLKDTHHRDDVPFNIWDATPETYSDISEALENRFGHLPKRDSFENAVISACDNICEDNYTDYLENLKMSVEGSFLDGYDEDNLRVNFLPILKYSTAYSVLTRLGYRGEDSLDKEDLAPLREFNTSDVINILGTASADLSELCLREIERTVRAYEKNKNRTLAANENVRYNDSENSKNHEKGEKDNEHRENAELQGGRGSSDPRPQAARTDELSPREVRENETRISQEASQGNLHDARDSGEAERASSRDRGSGEDADLREHITDGTEPWRDGTDESGRSDEVGTDDEQHQAFGRGGSFEELDLRLSDEDDPYYYDGKGVDPKYLDTEVKGDKPMPDEHTMILILRHGDYLRKSKEEIVSFLNSEEDEAKRAVFVRKAYEMGLTGEFYRPGTKEYLGYHVEPSGLLMYEGHFSNNTTEIKFTWQLVADLIHALAKDGKYLDEPKEKISLSPSEIEGASLKIIEKPAVKTRNEFTFPQSTIDEFIRIGGCTRKSTERIYGYYRRANDTAENIQFLREEYETDNVGLVIDGRKMAASWNDEGVTIAEGEKVAGAWRTVFLTWEDVDKRTRELIELGQYISRAQAQTAESIYDESVANKIADLYRYYFSDLPDENKTASRFVWPEITDFYTDILHDFDKAEALCNEMERNIKIKESRNAKYANINSPRYVLMLARQYLREPIEFKEADEYLLPQKFYITQDRIMSVLAGHHPISEGKFRVYSFFLKNKDNKSRADFLKKEYGIGGSYDSRVNKEYNSKGLCIGYSSIFVNEKVLLKWTDVAKRIDTLIREDKYLSKEEQNLLDWYEKCQIASAIQGFYSNRGIDVERPYKYDDKAFFEDKRKELLSQIDAPERLAEIYKMMCDVFETDTPDSYNYNYYKECLKDVREYVAGTYNLFPFSHYRRKAVEKAEASTEEVAEEDPAIDIDLDSLDYDIRLGTWVYIDNDELIIQSITSEGVELDDGSIFPVELSFDEFLEKLRSNPKNDHLKKSENVEVLDEPDPSKENTEASEKTDELERAKHLINDYSMSEFGYEDTFEDLHSIGIGYTTTEDDEISIQVEADLIDFNVKVYLGEDLVVTRQYGSLKELNDVELENLDFDSLIYIDDEIIEEYKRKHVTETEIPAMQEAPKPIAKRAGVKFHPEVDDEDRLDHKIDAKDLPLRVPSDKYSRNIRAIRLLHTLDEENRLATESEQKLLADYSGWGGLANCFDEGNSNYEELKSLLTYEEYKAARESTLTAFYTPPVVIQAIYKALANMGFTRGNILEPSCGVGNFMGLLPESMSESRIYGVELDGLSGRNAQQLYQKQNITIGGFEETVFPDSFFDVAVGNVPFGQFKVGDRKYDKFNFLIHDYFFAKALDKVRPGGVVAFITSKGTMDKENPAVRKYIAQRAELIGAIRLPDNAFKSAGTEVVSDIIFLQKRDRVIETEPDWVHLGQDANGIPMNQYFVDNPEMILGDIVMRSGPYGPEPTCKAYEGHDLGELLSEAVSNIHAEISEADIAELEEDPNSIPADPNVKNYSYTIVDGNVYFRQDSVMSKVETSVTGENRIKGMIGIRDTVRELIDAQLKDLPDYTITGLREKLNSQYDAFTAKYGLINSRGNESAFEDDSSYFLLSSLEILNEDKGLERKADMFTKRTIKPYVKIEHVDLASEALAVSLSEKAGIDIEFMSVLTGKTEDEIYEELKGVIFLNPEESAILNKPKYLTADEYLSGNVREKLARARRMVDEGFEEYSVNVDALEAIQPKDLTAAEIGIKLGATWIPPEIIKQFVFDLLSTPSWARWHIDVKYLPQTAQWFITEKSRDDDNVRALTVYGTSRVNAYEIIEETLNLKDVRVLDKKLCNDGVERYVLNKKETTVAQGKQEEIKRAFEEWAWKDPERREKLCKLYNEKFNSTRPRTYDGSHIKYFGMNPEITLRKHQTDAVARIMYGGNTLLGHVVGAGKTFTMVAAAQEMKRLGLCNKSMFVVPNHLIEQWAAEYLQLYPSANILVATKKDFEKKNRKKFCARIATGDYDAVIIGHSQFEKIPVSIVRQQRMLREEINEIVKCMSELKGQRGERITVKALERSKKQLEHKLEKLNDQTRKDNVVCFEELGVDRLFVDEAHFYKNLFCYTKMRNVSGIAQTEAQKSADLYMKCRYLDEVTGNKGVIFATGTPISNSMVELYTMQRYLQYDELKRRGLSAFDAWASTFGETITAIELAPDGSGYRAKTRFAKFFNIPELMAMFKQVADIQTADMLDLPVPKANYGIVKVPATEIQKKLVESFAKRAEKIHNGLVSSDEDNMLLVTNDGRKAALDQRLINPMFDDDENSKVNACVREIYETWKNGSEMKLTQLVFCDQSTPKNDGKFNVYDDIREKLVALGIPRDEIVFIHSAKTDAQKKELFKKVRAGQVRILMGSTFKMGAGTNVQRLLKRTHDLDCPWRPSDLEQRAGRIVRQGNLNPEVDISRYVTEGTFDAYLYQMVETKQRFISQIMTSKDPVRSAEDVDETALSYAEIKALASGNSMIIEKMQLDADVAKLRLQRSSYNSGIFDLQDKLSKVFPKDIKEEEARISGLEADIITAQESTHPNEKGFSPAVIMGVEYTEKAEAGKKILEVCKRITNPEARPLGEYRGFQMEIGFDTAQKEFFIKLIGKLRYTISLGNDANGIIQRLDNGIGSLQGRLEKCREALAELHKQVKIAEEEVTKPFPREEELNEKLSRLDYLNSQLNMDRRENEIADETPEQDGADETAPEVNEEPTEEREDNERDYDRDER